MGGARIEIGDDLIDGTVQNRLNEASPDRLTRQAEVESKPMAELTIRPDEIREALTSFVQAISPRAAREEIGTVIQFG